MKKIIIIILAIIIVISFFLTKPFSKKNNIDNDQLSQSKYYKSENKERYNQYRINNPTKDIMQVIIEVNIGLDKTFYTNTKEIKIPSSSLVLVNKFNFLNSTYVPDDLVKVDYTSIRRDAYDDFVEMKKEMAKNDLYIVAVSGYRSYSYQERLYNKYVRIDGMENADRYSARAGFSEHQTGLAIDVSNGKLPYTSFEKTKEFTWMINNCYKYGFILRYPKDKENITGYIYESWHFRYVGTEAASYIKKHNITFDEYYVMFID